MIEENEYNANPIPLLFLSFFLFNYIITKRTLLPNSWWDSNLESSSLVDVLTNNLSPLAHIPLLTLLFITKTRHEKLDEITFFSLFCRKNFYKKCRASHKIIPFFFLFLIKNNLSFQSFLNFATKRTRNFSS